MKNTIIRSVLTAVMTIVALTVSVGSVAAQTNPSPLAYKWPAMVTGATSGHACTCMAKEPRPQVEHKAPATRNQSPLAYKWPAMAK